MGSQHDLCSILTSMTMYHHKSSTSTVMHQYRYNARKSRDVTLLSCRSNHHGGPSPFLSRRFWVVPDVDQAPRPSTGTVRVAHAAIQASKQHRESRPVPYRGQDIQESLRVRRPVLRKCPKGQKTPVSLEFAKKITFRKNAIKKKH